jgi:ClpP class serine protease
LPYKRTSDGIGIVTVTGSLINRGAWVGSSSGETSYEGIKFQVASAAADPKVRSILLDIESPGGEAVGAFEAADAIRAAAKLKPVTAWSTAWRPRRLTRWPPRPTRSSPRRPAWPDQSAS